MPIPPNIISGGIGNCAIIACISGGIPVIIYHQVSYDGGKYRHDFSWIKLVSKILLFSAIGSPCKLVESVIEIVRHIRTYV